MQWGIKLTRTEMTALTLVAATRETTAPDLLRSRGLDDIVREYRELVEKIAQAS